MPSTEEVGRYRCGHCGNLTRFDITETTRTTSFHHYTTGGELIEVIDVRKLQHTIEEVKCRWCGEVKKVERIGEVMEGPDTT